MKIKFYLAVLFAALCMTNCSQEEEIVQTTQSSKSFTATIEGTSRSAVDSQTGVFTWTAGDKFSVWNGTSFDVYANSETDVNTFVAESQNAGDATGYAIYPSGSHGNISGSTVTVNLPAEYTYGSTNAPMLATIEEGSTNLSFKHLAGVMCFSVVDVPAGATKFVFTATNDILTGNYTVDSDGEIKKDGENTVNGNNSVTITFDALSAAQNMTFYVPLPVGTYGEYKVEIENNEDNLNLSHTSTNVSNTIGRRTLLLMPTFTVNNNTLGKGAGSTIAVTESEASVSGNQSLTIDTKNAGADATLQLNYTPQEGNATLNLSDGSTQTTPQTSTATVKVTPQGTTPVETLNINTPTLTVELGAGTYSTVNALTATETLVIGANVNIGKLVLNGGNVKLSDNATVKEFTIATGAETTIDLNGKTLSLGDATINNGLINNGKLVIKNGSISFSGSTANGAAVRNNAQIELNEVNVTSAHSAAFRNYGTTVENLTGQTADAATITAVIKGGTFTSNYSNTEAHSTHRYAVHAYMLSNLTMEGATVKGPGGVSVDVSFATLSNVKGESTCTGAHDLYVACGNATVTGCTFTNAAAYSEDSYGKAVVNGTTYDNGTTTIVAWTEIADASALISALANGGSYKLTTAITVNEALTVSKPIALDLNGNTLTISGESINNGLINNSNLSIKNGSISFSGSTANGAAVRNNAQIELNNVNVTSATSAAFRNYGTTVENLTGQTADAATITAVINGGTFTSNYSNTEAHSTHRYAVHAYMLSNLTMEDATVKGPGGVSVDVSFATLSNVKGESTCTGAHDLYVACGNATVTGCTFTNAVAYSEDSYGKAVVNGTTYDNGTTAITWQ